MVVVIIIIIIMLNTDNIIIIVGVIRFSSVLECSLGFCIRVYVITVHL